MPSSINVRHLTTVALLTAMALAVQYLESLLPPLVPGVPVKLGLANSLTLFALLRFKRADALAVSLLRCLLFALVTGAVSGALYALSGSLLSLAGMGALLPLVRRARLSPMGLSVAGAFLYNLGQLAVGAAALGGAMLFYLPYMGLLSIPFGLATGFLAQTLEKRMKRAG